MAGLQAGLTARMLRIDLVDSWDNDAWRREMVEADGNAAILPEFT